MGNGNLCSGKEDSSNLHRSARRCMSETLRQASNIGSTQRIGSTNIPTFYRVRDRVSKQVSGWETVVMFWWVSHNKLSGPRPLSLSLSRDSGMHKHCHCPFCRGNILRTIILMHMLTSCVQSDFLSIYIDERKTKTLLLPSQWNLHIILKIVGRDGLFWHLG